MREARAAARRSGRRSGSRVAPPVTVLVGFASAAAGALTSGRPAALAALLATAVVVGFFAGGALPLLAVRGQEQRAGLGMMLLLLTYTLRLAAALLVLRLVAGSGAVDSRWLGLTIIACALVWTGTQVALVARLPAPSTLRRP